MLKKGSGEEKKGGGGVYISTCVLVKIAEAGDIEVESAWDFLSISENGIDVVVGAHAVRI